MPSTDPNIILEAGNLNNPQQQEQGLISMFSLAQGVKQAQRAEQRTNALKDAFLNPDSVDATTGLPTPQAIRKVMTVDPELGVKLQDEALEAQVKRAQAQHYKTEVGKNNFDFMSTAAGIGVDAYEAKKKSGGTEEDALAAGRAARNDAVKNNGGVIGDDIADGIISKPFDPAGARALAGSNKEWATLQHQERADDERRTHEGRLEDIMAVNAGMKPFNRGGSAAPAEGAPDGDPFAAFAAKMNKAENATGNPAAKNPLSSATGDGQFTEATWLTTAKADHPEWVKAGLTDKQMLALRTDPDTSLGATASLAKKNAQALTTDGIPVTGANLALAHHFGAGDAPKIIQADPATPIEKLVSPLVMKENPDLVGKTAGQVVGTYASQFGNAPISTSGGAAPEKVNLGKGAVAMKDSDGTVYYVNPARPGIAADDKGMPYTPKGGGAKLGSASSGGEFTPKMGELGAALAERGVSLPSGFRSKAQQIQLYDGLLKRNPDLTVDQIADKVEKGQIDFGVQKKETQVAATIAGRVRYAESELAQNIPLVREASAKVSRKNFMPVAKLMQMGEKQINDPALKQLKIYINSMMNSYDMLAARGGTDVGKREEAHQLITTADSQEALEVGLKAFEKEVQIAKRAADESTNLPLGKLLTRILPANSKDDYDAMDKGQWYSKPGDAPGTHRVKM